MAKKKISGGRKNDDNDGTEMVVLKINTHCEGCAQKIAKSILSLDGVKSVKRGENELMKIMVVGKVNPVELREDVEEKIKKKVELISPTTKKQKGFENNKHLGGGGEQKKHKKQPTAAVNGEDKSVKLPETTTVLKVSLHCQGCIDKIKKLVRKTKGFKSLSIDKNNDLVTVKGRIDVNLLTAALMNKLNTKVEVVPAKSGDGGAGRKGKGGGGDGEGEEFGGGGRRMEGHKMEYFVGQGQYMYPQYVNRPAYTFSYMHITEMFNDENANACVVM